MLHKKLASSHIVFFIQMSQIKPSSHNCVLNCSRNVRLLTLSLILVTFSRTTSEVSSLCLIIHSQLQYLLISCSVTYTTENIWLRTAKINNNPLYWDFTWQIFSRYLVLICNLTTGINTASFTKISHQCTFLQKFNQYVNISWWSSDTLYWLNSLLSFVYLIHVRRVPEGNVV